MSHRSRTFFLFAAAVLCVNTSMVAESPVSGTWQSDANRAWESACTVHRPLFLYVTMTGCHYCRKMERESLADNSVASAIETKFVAASLTAEKNPELVKRLGIRTYPTTVIISPQVGVLDRMSGYVGPAELRDRLRIAAEKVSTQMR